MNLDGALAFFGDYVTEQARQLTYSPAETWILALSLAAALLSGFHLWRIARREEAQRHRLGLLRGAPAETDETAGVRRLPWYRRLGNWIAASPIVGTVEQQRGAKRREEDDEREADSARHKRVQRSAFRVQGSRSGSGFTFWFGVHVLVRGSRSGSGFTFWFWFAFSFSVHAVVRILSFRLGLSHANPNSNPNRNQNAEPEREP